MPRAWRAILFAIPRAAITTRLLDGLAIPASQIMPPGQSRHDPTFCVEPADPDAARRPAAVTWTPVPQLTGTSDMAAGFGPSRESFSSGPVPASPSARARTR
jgi:ABC-type transport system substrate-binding protein